MSSADRKKGPAERGHVKKRQKSPKRVKNIFDTFWQFSRRAKNAKNRQKMSKTFWTLFENFRAAPVFRPLLGGSDVSTAGKSMNSSESPSLEPLLNIKASNALNYRAWGIPAVLSRGKTLEKLWERFRGLSGIFPEFPLESPSRTGGVA